MRYIFTLLLIIFLCCASIHADSYAPVPIEPYPEESSRVIKESMDVFQSDFGRIVVSGENLQKAAQMYKENPNDLNAANLMQEKSRTFSVTMEFLTKANRTFKKVTPELGRLRDYLVKYSASIDKDNPLMKKQLRCLGEDAKTLENFISYLGKVKEDFQSVQKLFKNIGTVWVNTEEINMQFKNSFGSRNIKGLVKDLTGVADELAKIKDMLMDSLDNNIGSLDDCQEDMNNYQNSMSNIFQGTRR